MLRSKNFQLGMALQMAVRASPKQGIIGEEVIMMVEKICILDLQVFVGDKYREKPLYSRQKILISLDPCGAHALIY